MKQASLGLIDLLLTGSFVTADLYTFNLVGGGTPIRISAADVDIAVGGNVWLSRNKGPNVDSDKIQKATAHWKVGLDVDTWQVAICPRAVDPLTNFPFPDTIGGQPWLSAVSAGGLDGAEVQIDRAYWAKSWPVSATAIVPAEVLSSVFAGRVAQVDLARTSAIVSINSHLELLTQTQMPRNLHQASCVHTLFDAGCTLLAPGFAQNGIVSAVNSQSSIEVSVPPATGSGTYALGRLVFTSGANNTFARMIKSQPSGTATMNFLVPLPFPIAVGDSFTAYPGCNKSVQACQGFGNFVNYGGEPFVPSPEAAI